MFFFIAQDINTLYVALYGAGLSTITLGVLIYARYFDRRIRIRVTVSKAAAIRDGTRLVEVRVSNIGMRATSIDAPIFKLPHNRQLIPTIPYDQSVRVPYEFSAGKPDFIVRHRIESLTSSLKKEGYSGLVPFAAVVPGTGENQYKSKKMVFDLDGGSFISNSPIARLRRMLRRALHATTP